MFAIAKPIGRLPVVLSQHTLHVRIDVLETETVIGVLTLDSAEGNVHLFASADCRSVDEAVAHHLMLGYPQIYFVGITGLWAYEAPHAITRLMTYLEHSIAYRPTWIAARLTSAAPRELAMYDAAIIIEPPAGAAPTLAGPVPRTIQTAITANNANLRIGATRES